MSIPDDLFKPMSAAQYRKCIETMDLGAAGVARMLDFTPRMSRSYVNGDYPVPLVIAVALRLIRDNVKPKELEHFKSGPVGRPPKDEGKHARA